jgi:hypothetical protein
VSASRPKALGSGSAKPSSPTPTSPPPKAPATGQSETPVNGSSNGLPSFIRQMVPVLQPIDDAPGPRVFRPLFTGHDASPLNVFYASVSLGQQMYLMSDDFERTGMKLRRLEVRCINNWWDSHKDLLWEPFDKSAGEKSILVARSRSYSLSTILLSHGHLKGFHKHFGADMIFLGVPDRSTVLVHNDKSALIDLVESMYRDAFRNGTQLSPCVFVSQNGHVAGYAEPKSDEDGNAEEADDQSLFLAIQKTLCYAFQVVSIADKEPEIEEITKFAEVLNNFADQGNTVVHRASAAMHENDFAVLEEVLQSGAGRAVMLMLDCLRSLKQELAEPEYAILRITTTDIAREVAAATNDNAGTGISKNKQDALDVIAGLFNIA